MDPDETPSNLAIYPDPSCSTVNIKKKPIGSWWPETRYLDLEILIHVYLAFLIVLYKRYPILANEKVSIIIKIIILDPQPNATSKLESVSKVLGFRI